jgi:hypothetical protein
MPTLEKLSQLVISSRETIVVVICYSTFNYFNFNKRIEGYTGALKIFFHSKQKSRTTFALAFRNKSKSQVYIVWISESVGATLWAAPIRQILWGRRPHAPVLPPPMQRGKVEVSMNEKRSVLVYLLTIITRFEQSADRVDLSVE